jgi:SulP family sulfate permease
MELGTPLNYNRELATVGFSNLISGICGGYSGSYIFSPTILQLKAGVDLRLCGLVIAMIELNVVLIPISLTSYIPKLFFGSLLLLIASDLMYDWLIDARHKMMLSEYTVCLVTFLAIQIFGIEGGELRMLLIWLIVLIGLIFSRHACWCDVRHVFIHCSLFKITICIFIYAANLYGHQNI